jgi:hypothetical protein
MTEVGLDETIDALDQMDGVSVFGGDKGEVLSMMAQANTAYNAKALAFTFETAARMAAAKAAEDPERWQALLDMFGILAVASEAVADAAESVLGETE